MNQTARLSCILVVLLGWIASPRLARAIDCQPATLGNLALNHNAVLARVLIDATMVRGANPELKSDCTFFTRTIRLSGAKDSWLATINCTNPGTSWIPAGVAYGQAHLCTSDRIGLLRLARSSDVFRRSTDLWHSLAAKKAPSVVAALPGRPAISVRIRTSSLPVRLTLVAQIVKNSGTAARIQPSSNYIVKSSGGVKSAGMIVGIGAHSPPLISSASSSIVDNTNKLCVTVFDAGMQVGAKVVEAPCAALPNQTFVPAKQPDDFELLQDAHSGNCLAPVDDATRVGTLLITSPCNLKNTAQEFFTVYQRSPHSFAILNRKSGLCLQQTVRSSQLSLGDCSSMLPLTFTIAGLNPPGPNPRPAYAADGIGRAASAPGTPAGTYRTVIADKTFYGDISLYGSTDTLFMNNTIVGGTLKIDGATNVYVKGNTIENGEIWFRDESPSNNVVVDGNEIFGSGADGIQLYQDFHGHSVNPTNVRIINNEIHDTGIAYPGSGLYHGIYDMVPNVLVENNLFYHNKDAVSIRNSGTISRNVFRNNLANAAIFYEPNHDAPAGSTLLIENNVIDSQVINEQAGLGTNRGLIGLGNGPSVPVTHYTVRFNTVVVENAVNDSTGIYWDILTQFAFSSEKTGDVYGNILVNPLHSDYVGFSNPTYESGNYETQSNSAPGFSNPSLEIETRSPAATLATKETNYPATDRNLQPRPSSTGIISTGAYQAQ
jgi:hypothetical protein